MAPPSVKRKNLKKNIGCWWRNESTASHKFDHFQSHLLGYQSNYFLVFKKYLLSSRRWKPSVEISLGSKIMDVKLAKNGSRNYFSSIDVWKDFLVIISVVFVRFGQILVGLLFISTALRYKFGFTIFFVNSMRFLRPYSGVTVQLLSFCPLVILSTSSIN